jgi:hypothetical protein
MPNSTSPASTPATRTATATWASPGLLDTARHPALTFDGAAADTTVDGVLTGRAGAQVRLDVTNLTPGDDGMVTVHATTALPSACGHRVS